MAETTVELSEITSEEAIRIHSLTFFNGVTKKNTYDDWHLVPESRPLVVPPTPKTKYLDVPGADGQLDLSEALTDHPVFNNRDGEWSFYVLNGFGEWYDRYSAIMTFLQGRSLKVILNDDPTRYWSGRFYVSKWDSSGSEGYSKITFNYHLNPYKVNCTITKHFSESNPSIEPTYFLVDSGGNSL